MADAVTATDLPPPTSAPSHAPLTEQEQLEAQGRLMAFFIIMLLSAGVAMVLWNRETRNKREHVAVDPHEDDAELEAIGTAERA